MFDSLAKPVRNISSIVFFILFLVDAAMADAINISRLLAAAVVEVHLDVVALTVSQSMQGSM